LSVLTVPDRVDGGTLSSSTVQPNSAIVDGRLYC